MKASDGRRLVTSQSVVRAELEGEAILLNLETGIYFGLDQLGNEIWTALQQGVSEDDILSRLLDEYDVEPSRLRADMANFLKELHAHRLVHEIDE